MTSSAPVIAECNDISEKIDFFESSGFYIKPIARLNMTIQLPPTKTPGQPVSPAEIIEKLRKQSLPEEFIYLRVIKSTLEFIRCEGEIENKSSLKALISKLDGSSIKMLSYTDVLKVRAAEAKITYPTRHDWDSYFKDALNPDNELNPGERPDTIHVQDLPISWFGGKDKPNEALLRDVFGVFGEIRLTDIPFSPASNKTHLTKSSMNDDNMNSTTTTTPFQLFEAFIQYKDYISFVKAMDTFRGMKLLFIEDKKDAYTANIRIDFDRTRHLSDKEIKKREIDKLKAIEIEKIKNAQQEKDKEKAAKRIEISKYHQKMEESGADDGGGTTEKSKEQRRREREEARRQKRIVKKKDEEDKKFNTKVAAEERKILIAQRKLESYRLLEELFNRVKVVVAQEDYEKRTKEMKEEERRQAKKNEEDIIEQENKKKLKFELEDKELQEKILQRDLARQNEENEAIKLEEIGEFELRKNPSMNSPPNSKQPTNGESTNSFLAMPPRSVLMSSTGNNVEMNQSLQNQTAQLYDEEDEQKMMSPLNTSDVPMATEHHENDSIMDPAILTSVSESAVSSNKPVSDEEDEDDEDKNDIKEEDTGEILNDEQIKTEEHDVGNSSGEIVSDNE